MKFGFCAMYFVHVVPAVFPDDGIERVERRVVVRGICRHELAGELGFEKIERRFRHFGRRNKLAVVGVGQQHHAGRGEGAVLVAKPRIDAVVTFRLERQQHTGFFPGDEILRGLENCHVDLELLRGHLRVDPAVKHVEKPPVTEIAMPG